MRPKAISKGNRNAVRAVRRKRINTTIATETMDYLLSRRDEMPFGELIDAAIKLYRQVNDEEDTRRHHPA